MILRGERFQRLDCIGGVDHFADLRREGEEWHDVLPRPPPGRPDRGVALAPLGFEVRRETGKELVGRRADWSRRRNPPRRSARDMFRKIGAATAGVADYADRAAPCAVPFGSNPPYGPGRLSAP